MGKVDAKLIIGFSGLCSQGSEGEREGGTEGQISASEEKTRPRYEQDQLKVDYKE